MAYPRVESRVLLGGLITALTLIAWWALWSGESAGWGHHALHASPAIFITGWTVMTIAMMLPTSAPLILMFYRMVDGRAAQISLLIGAYLAVWVGFGAIVYLVSYWLSRALPGFVGGTSASALILLAAGVYQFTPLKYACLDKCRSPMAFLMQNWNGNAFRLGAAHGAFCVGCCWSLMLVMFAVGAGNVAWMLALGIVMAVEKNLPWGRRLSAPLGFVLIAAGVAVIGIG